jgi:hypothetical protein
VDHDKVITLGVIRIHIKTLPARLGQALAQLNVEHLVSQPLSQLDLPGCVGQFDKKARGCAKREWLARRSGSL